jgi:hypothetical protein
MGIAERTEAKRSRSSAIAETVTKRAGAINDVKP